MLHLKLYAYMSLTIMFVLNSIPPNTNNTPLSLQPTLSLPPSFPVLGSLLFKSNSLHITLYFEDDLCITVTYYLETKVTIIY